MKRRSPPRGLVTLLLVTGCCLAGTLLSARHLLQNRRYADELRLADSLGDAGKYEDAARIYEKLLTGEGRSTTGEARAELRYRAGINRMNASQEHLAKIHFTRILDLAEQVTDTTLVGDA